jgi:hypothetical protein
MPIKLLFFFIVSTSYQIQAQSLSTSDRIELLIRSKVEYITNCHGTVRFALGETKYPLFAAYLPQEYFEKNCSKKPSAKNVIKVAQVYEYGANGAAPVHSYIELQNKTFSKDGPDLNSARYSTVNNELSPYQVLSRCRNITEDEASLRGCLSFSEVYYCKDKITNVELDNTLTLNNLLTRIAEINKSHSNSCADEIENLKDTLDWTEFWIRE